MTQVLIYAGGIMVLYLFGLMLTKPSPHERNLQRIGLAAGLAGTLSVIFLVQLFGGIDESVPEAASLPAPEPTAEAIGLAFLRADEWLFAFEFASVLLLATVSKPAYSRSSRTVAYVRFLNIGASIANMRMRQRDNLLRVGRIGQDFLITGDRGVEHNLTN